MGKCFIDPVSCPDPSFAVRFSFFMTSLMGLGLIIVEVLRSHSFKHATLGRTSLDEWSARDLYLATNTTLKKQTSMPPAGFETTVPASEQPQTHALGYVLRGSDQRARASMRVWAIDGFVSYVDSDRLVAQWRNWECACCCSWRVVP